MALNEAIKKYRSILIQKRYSEIYTHVSKRAIDKIKNPIDDFFE